MNARENFAKELTNINPLGVGQALWDIIENMSCFIIEAHKRPDGTIDYSTRPMQLQNFPILFSNLCRTVPLAMNGHKLLQVGVDLRSMLFVSYGIAPQWEDACHVLCSDASRLYLSYIAHAINFAEHVAHCQLIVEHCPSKRAVRNLHIELICTHCALEAAKKAKRARKPASRSKKKTDSEPIIIEAPVGTIQFHGIDCRAPEEFRAPLQKALKSAIRALLQELAAELPAISEEDGLLAFPQDPEDIVANGETEHAEEEVSGKLETRHCDDEDVEEGEVVTLQ